MIGTQSSANSVVVTSVAPASPATFSMHFGARHADHIHGAITDYFESLCGSADTQGWEVHNLSNGGVFMCPAGNPESALRVVRNGVTSDISPQAAGILACLCTYSAWLGITGNRAFAFHYERVRDYAAGLPESTVILRAIDQQPFSF